MNNLQDKCPSCNEKMELKPDIAELLCSKCGYTDTIMIISEKNSFNDPPREVSYYAYKHFYRWEL